MTFARNGDVHLYFETRGAAPAPGVLLINGAGRQAIDYDDAFCDALVARGFRVVRYDQRDTGLSSSFADHPPDAVGVAAAIAAAAPCKIPYDIHALADDALAVMDAAGLHAAHVFARSLGSLAAQLIARDHPSRVLSATLAMAMSRSIGANVTVERLRQLDDEVFATETDYVARQVATARALGNPDYFDAARIEAAARLAFQRGVHPGATARHFMVGLAAPDIRASLGRITAPVQVIHGRRDKVIPLLYAQETAAAIPGARLAVLDDMAHEAPPALWARWIDLFVANAARAVT